MTKKRYPIRPLDKSDLTTAAGICADAMNDNPIHIKVFGTLAVLRKQRLKRLFSGLLPYIYRKGSLYGAFNDDTLVGVLGVLPPNNCKPTFREFIRLLPALLISNNPAGTFRLATWLGAWAKADSAIPHWHIGPLAIVPVWQHLGIGSQLMEHALHTFTDTIFYLETDKLTNVEFYERFGFSVLATVPVLSTPSWIMARAAIH